MLKFKNGEYVIIKSYSQLKKDKRFKIAGDGAIYVDIYFTFPRYPKIMDALKNRIHKITVDEELNQEFEMEGWTLVPYMCQKLNRWENNKIKRRVINENC